MIQRNRTKQTLILKILNKIDIQIKKNVLSIDNNYHGRDYKKVQLIYTKIG